MRRFDESVDARLRDAAFSFLRALGPEALVSQHDLSAFTFDGVPVRLMAPQQGIWKPRQLDAALSIRTVFAATPAARPYADAIGADGFGRYKWRGTNPAEPENRALRAAMARGLPLIWFYGIAPGRYLPLFPVYLAAEEPNEQQFVVALDHDALALRRELADTRPEIVRAYAESLARARLHQRAFRERVLLAYAYQCAVCRLRHRQLLDAAHVLSDAAGGEPVVTNGISMCKIHHAAYDADIIGIAPDYRIGVRPDVLREHDGPTLRYAPDPDLLEVRWQRFLAAS
ncbi:MAG TPA: HNH endonuclease [Acidimicrobiales bacterium]|nr:HNH endonuclease [Acidimicrobiales bacterium]